MELNVLKGKPRALSALLSDIPDDWSVSTIGKQCEIGGGSTPSRLKPEYFVGDIPWIRSTELKYSTIKTSEESITREGFDSISLRVYPRGALLIAITGFEAEGTRGKCALLGINAAINQSCAAIQSRGDINIPFLFYYYQSLGDRIMSLARGTKQQSLTLSSIKTIPIPLPPMEEQKIISQVFASVDKWIERTKELAGLYILLKKGLVQRLLTRGIGHTRFKKTKVGEIPEKWDIKSLGDVCNVVSGSAFPIKYQGKHDGEYPIYKVSDMNLEGNEKFMRGANNTVGRHELDAMNAKVFPADTVIFPKLGAALLTNKRRILTRDSTFDNNIMGLIPKAIHPAYLYSFMQSIDFARYVQMGAVPSIRLSAVQSMRIQIPPQEEQAKIASILSELDMLMNNELVNRGHLEHLKKGLMQVLLTGKVRVGA